MPQSGVTASRGRAQRDRDWLYEDSDLPRVRASVDPRPLRAAADPRPTRAGADSRPVRAASQPRPVPASGSHLSVVEAPRVQTPARRPRPAAAPRPETQAPRARTASAPAQTRAGSTNGGVPGRRTITITGQGAERYAAQTRRRPSQRPYERPGFRPDRAALWAVLLGVLLILVAATSSHAAVISAGHALISSR
jgi:hypothetical protein